MAATHHITIHRRNRFELDVRLLDESGAIDLTGSTFVATIFRTSSARPTFQWSGAITNAGQGRAELVLDREQTEALRSGRLHWELEWVDAGGEPWDLLEG